MEIKRIKEMSDREWSEFRFKEDTRRTFERMKKFSRTLTQEDLENEPTALANSSYREKIESEPKYILISGINKSIYAIEDLLESTSSKTYEEIYETLKEIKVKLNNIKDNG